jgi:hypothetical protein
MSDVASEAEGADRTRRRPVEGQRYTPAVGRSMTRRWLVLAASSASLLWACTLFNPLDEYGPPVPKPLEASAPPSSGDAAPDQDEGCGVRWPRRPARDDLSGAVEPLVFAMDGLALSLPEDAGANAIDGYDLDGVCTCPGPPSCVAPPGVEVTCDGDGGTDRAGSALLETLAQLGESKGNPSGSVRAGGKNVLLRLRNYNGGLDDTSVELAAYLSHGTEGIQGGKPKVPAFDGSDVWTVDPLSLAGGAAPPYVPLTVDTNAYVSGGTLVAEVDVPLPLGLDLKVRGGVLTAKLLRDGASYRLDGIVVGRYPTGDFLTHLDVLRDPFNDSGLCGTSRLYADIKATICARVDIAADRTKDGTSAPCDSLGVALLFTAGPATLGAVFQRPPPARGCGEAWSDDCAR